MLPFSKEVIVIDNILLEAKKRGILNEQELGARIEEMKKQEAIFKHPFTIYQDNQGRYCTYFCDKDGKRVKKVKKKREDLENEIYRFYLSEEDCPTIDEIFTEWCQIRVDQGKIKVSSYERNKQTYKRFYKEFGQRKIRYVDIFDFVDFLEAQIPKYKLTAKAFCDLKTITKGIIQRAKRKKLIDYTADDVFSELCVLEKSFAKNHKSDDEEVFTEDELPRVITYLIGNKDILNLGILLLFVTGLRIGELAALRFDDINNNVIHIKRTETRHYENGKGVYSIQDCPKTDAGDRMVVIPKDFMWIINTLRQMFNNNGFVFQKDGERICTYSFRNRLRTICRKLGCTAKSPHKIRKTYGSILLDNHMDNRLVMAQMGHTDISCTETHYHRNRRNEESMVDIISAIPEFQLTTP